MNKVILTTNDAKHKSLEVVVSNAHLSKLEKLTTLGGFQRFLLSHYSDDEPKQQSNYKSALSFLAVFAFGTDSKTLSKLI